jgi:hypothetical protein
MNAQDLEYFQTEYRHDSDCQEDSSEQSEHAEWLADDTRERARDMNRELTSGGNYADICG